MLRVLRAVVGTGRADHECVHQLTEAYRRLCNLGDDWRKEVYTPVGRAAAEAFLKMLDKSCELFRAPRANRNYRDRFTDNYKILLPRSARSYHFDLWKACMVDENEYIYVNGDGYQLAVPTLESIQRLQSSWKALTALLDTSGALSDSIVEDLHSVLSNWDAAWATFECQYITELIEIESRARGYVLKAAREEEMLTAAEKTSTDVQMRRRALVESINKLNSVANRRRKGRDDLDSSILEMAINQQMYSDESESAKSNAALMFARDVTQSFDALRSYLRNASKVMAKVDPHLCNNSGLVDRLVDWEESWEVGQRFVRHPVMLNALCDIVAELRKVQDCAPMFKQMCDDCDVELFLSAPRLIWLRFLDEPAECGEFVKDLLPHRFVRKEASNADGTAAQCQCAGTPNSCCTCRNLPQCSGDNDIQFCPVDAELTKLQECYRSICQKLIRSRPSSRSPRPSDRGSGSVCIAWELLTRRVVCDRSDSQALYDLLVPPADRATLVPAIEEFLLELEKWSLELQRHNANDWNRSCALLIQCLLGREEKTCMDECKEFRV